MKIHEGRSLLSFTFLEDVPVVFSTFPDHSITVDHGDPVEVYEKQTPRPTEGFEASASRNTGDVVAVTLVGRCYEELREHLEFPRHRPAKEIRPFIEFDYVNWRGEDHHYLVEVEGVECGPYDAGGTHAAHSPDDVHWVMNGIVVTRDGEVRETQDNGRRTFLLGKIRNIGEVTRTA